MIERNIGFFTSGTRASRAWRSAFSKRKTSDDTANFRSASDSENDNDEGVDHSDPEKCICGFAWLAHAGDCLFAASCSIKADRIASRKDTATKNRAVN